MYRYFYVSNMTFCNSRDLDSAKKVRSLISRIRTPRKYIFLPQVSHTISHHYRREKNWMCLHEYYWFWESTYSFFRYYFLHKKGTCRDIFRRQTWTFSEQQMKKRWVTQTRTNQKRESTDYHYYIIEFCSRYPLKSKEAGIFVFRMGMMKIITIKYS